MSTKLRQRTRQLLGIFKKCGVLRAGDLKKYGMSRSSLSRLVQIGLIVRIGRGLYTLADAENATGFRGFVEASKKAPHGVICLLSALVFHELTTQAPFEVWMTFDVKARIPKSTAVSIRAIRSSGRAFDEGIEVHRIEGVKVRIYNPAKTVVDCFKFRNKFGLDVALEALRDCLEQRKCTSEDIWKYAKICRVEKIIRPYLEALSS